MHIKVQDLQQLPISMMNNMQILPPLNENIMNNTLTNGLPPPSPSPFPQNTNQPLDMNKVLRFNDQTDEKTQQTPLPIQHTHNKTHHLLQNIQQNTPQMERKHHSIKDMDEHYETTDIELSKFRDMLENTQTLIGDMLELCNARSYGLRKLNMDQKMLENCMKENIQNYTIYVDDQLFEYQFNISSNAIVDLIGVPHTMDFIIPAANGQQYQHKMYDNIYINTKGFVLYFGKRLTSHFYWNVLTASQRTHVDNGILWSIKTYIHQILLMERWRYPTKEMLQGIKTSTIEHFQEQQWLFFSLPKKRRNGKKKYCVIIFPNHKKHLGKGIWSRSVTYFDNVVRGSQISFLKHCQQEKWGIVCLNPNENIIQSQHFSFKQKKQMMNNSVYDNPKYRVNSKSTETVTLPTSESSKSHVLSVYQHFIKPVMIDEHKCKLLLLSHCEGGEDVLHLLEQVPESHEHIIGVALLDFYTWSLEEMNKSTKQVIEQRSAVYMSLHGSNESAYGFEPSAAKSPVTIFRTANKEKRYSPIYNQESVIRFFKSKIELNQEHD